MTRPSFPYDHRTPPPLDTASLERLALRYVERFATTQARLTDYLVRKIRERGWTGEQADPAVIAARMAGLGYVDDRSYAEAKAIAMARRGLGPRRVVGTLRQAGVTDGDVEALASVMQDRAVDAAMAFARRRRIGPFAEEAADRDTREKQIAAMLRGGHSPTIARRIATMSPGDDFGEPDV